MPEQNNEETYPTDEPVNDSDGENMTDARKEVRESALPEGARRLPVPEDRPTSLSIYGIEAVAKCAMGCGETQVVPLSAIFDFARGVPGMPTCENEECVAHGDPLVVDSRGLVVASNTPDPLEQYGEVIDLVREYQNVKREEIGPPWDDGDLAAAAWVCFRSSLFERSISNPSHVHSGLRSSIRDILDEVETSDHLTDEHISAMDSIDSAMERLEDLAERHCKEDEDANSRDE